MKSEHVRSHVSRGAGFTLVELLIVIVVIGILAAITIIAYNGITDKARATVLQSDLSQGGTQLGMYYAENGVYPSSLTETDARASTGDTLTYTQVEDGYCLQADGFGQTYYMTDDNTPVVGSCPPSAPSVYASDDFNRTNSSSLGNTVVGNFPWQTSTPGQVWSISSNKLVSTGQSGVTHAPIAYVDAAQQNGVAQVTVSSIQTDCAGIIVRYNTSTRVGLALLGCDDPGWNVPYAFVHIFTDNSTGGEAITSPSVSKLAAAGDVIKLTVNGNTFTGYVNGVQVTQYTDSSYAGTNVGVYDDNEGAGTGISYDDFSWSPLP